jgi:hypothetical protein
MALTQTRIEVSNAVFSLPYHVAKEEGYFAAEGCVVELVPADWMTGWDLLDPESSYDRIVVGAPVAAA